MPSATTCTVTGTVTSRCSFTGTVDLADLLDRLGELQLAPVDVEALRGQRLGDVGRGDRAVQRLGLADSSGDDDFDAGQPRGDGLDDLRFSSASLASNLARSRSICFLLPSVASSASLRGSR